VRPVRRARRVPHLRVRRPGLQPPGRGRARCGGDAGRVLVRGPGAGGRISGRRRIAAAPSRECVVRAFCVRREPGPSWGTAAVVLRRAPPAAVGGRRPARGDDSARHAARGRAARAAPAARAARRGDDASARRGLSVTTPERRVLNITGDGLLPDTIKVARSLLPDGAEARLMLQVLGLREHELLGGDYRVRIAQYTNIIRVLRFTDPAP